MQVLAFKKNLFQEVSFFPDLSHLQPRLWIFSEQNQLRFLPLELETV